MGETADAFRPANLFSDKCLYDKCRTARTFSARTCDALGKTGVKQCPGLLPKDGVEICSLPGEIAERIAGDYPGVPDKVLLNGAHLIAQGRLAVHDLPQGCDDYGANMINWTAIIAGHRNGE